jgi:hypothetical protein
MGKRIEVSMIVYKKRLLVVLVAGIVLGIIISGLFILGYSLVRDPKISEKGTTVLVDGDGVVRVPKGALIEGNAIEVIDLDGEVSTENIRTPFTTTESILIKTNSICVISLPDRYGVNYGHEDLAKKILK